jgi:aminoglycoside 3-N-acetyltransferase
MEFWTFVKQVSQQKYGRMIVHRKMEREIRRVNRWLHPLSWRQVLEALQTVGPFCAQGLMVHSSLSELGYIRGGPAAVIHALRAWTRERDLVMPTHTYCYPDNDGRNPLFDPAVTRSRVGAITDAFWRRPHVVRSLHPTHSLACWGAGAEKLCAGHELCNTPCGEGTPYEKLVKQEFSVLMFGVTLNTYTLFHTAEDAAQVPYLYESKPYRLQFVDRAGQIQEITTRRHDMRIVRRFAQMDSWLEQRGLLVRRALGLGQLMFIPSARAVHQQLLEALHVDPTLLVTRVARR